MKKTTITLILILVCPTIVFASGEVHHVSIEETYKFWPQFLAFCALLYFLLKKPFLKVWEDRTIRIAEEATAGERRLAEAKDRLSFARTQIESVKDEMTQLREKATKETENEISAILSEATERADKIIDQAKVTIETERLVRENELQEEFAENVIARAREKLSTSLSDDDDKALRASVMKGLSGLQH